VIPISSALAAHYAQGTTTLAMCWRVELVNGDVYGFTAHDEDLLIDGVIYSASTGMTPSAIVGTATFAPDNMEVQSVLNADFITDEDLNAGLWDYAEVFIFEINYKAIGDGPLRIARGRLGEVTARRNDFTAELRGLSDAYSRMVGQLYGPACRADLGDARCKVDLAAYTVSGTVQAVSGDGRVITDSARTEAGPAGGKAITGVSRAAEAVITCPAHGFKSGERILITGVSGVTQQSLNGINGRNYLIAVIAPDRFSIGVDTRALASDAANGPTDPAKVYSAYISGGLAVPSGNAGYFTYGLITMTSGENIGLSMEVGAYAPGTISLRLAFPYPLAVGDTYTMSAGCGKRFLEDCLVRFNNADNFRGEPFLPGMDRMLVVGGQAPGQGGE
jgi:uncharacterized phage protein (TIGR02218 family)